MSNTGKSSLVKSQANNRDVLLPSRKTVPSASNTGSALLDPITNPNAWMFLLVENQQVPGWITSMDGFGLKTGWDVKSGKGAKGANLTLTSQPPSKGSITWTIVRGIQFSLWAEFLPRFKYQPDKNASTQAVAVYHPALADVGVTSVVVEEIGIWKHMGRMKYERKIDFIVWTPPPTKSIVATPTRASETGSGSSAKGVPDDPVADAEQRQIAQLLQQAQALHRGPR